MGLLGGSGRHAAWVELGRAVRDGGRRGRWLLVVGASLGLANCAGPTAGKFGNKYGVKPSPKVVADGDPIPKGGGRAMVGQPYVVGGRTYVPHSGAGYDRVGMASWYGTAFHGRLTANGEVFDRDSIAAAHPTLPLPSYVRVTNLDNKRSMVVRVNDRGPYERDRIIDVSERAADALGFHRRGTTRVAVQYIGKAALAGSDDRKLLASLRTDGTPAALGRSGAPVMVADLRHPVPTRAPEPAEPRARPAAQVVAATEAERPSRIRVAADMPAAAEAPVAALPPERPVLSGIY